MSDYLMRDQSPLSSEQWEHLDRVVVETARRTLVGRRFIPIVGPFGAGVQSIAVDVFGGIGAGKVNLLGEDGMEPVIVGSRTDMRLPIIYKDFRIHWRDVETSQKFGVPLDLGPAAAASAFCAYAEDDLIFNDHAGLGYPGLLNVDGRTTIPRSNWDQMGKAFEDVVSATEKLISAGYYGPYALVVSPALYAAMNRVFENTGVLEIEQVRKIVTDGVFQSPVLPDGAAVVISTGAQNMDLAVAEDLTTAFLETSQMNHYFRVFEVVALRIKRPGAICTLE